MDVEPGTYTHTRHATATAPQDDIAPLDLGALTQQAPATYEDMVRGHIVCLYIST
jgi:hypothetical protein